MPTPSKESSDLFAGQVALISGAGGACALVLAEIILARSGSVVLLDTPGKALEKNYDALADKFGFDEHSTQLSIYPLDLAHAGIDDYEKLRSGLGAQYQSLDILIHNTAALCPPQGLDEISAQDWYRLFQINVHAPWLIQRALLGWQLKSKNPRIVFVVDETDQAWLGSYALSKTTQIHLMRAWAREFKPGRTSNGPVIAGLSVTGLGTEAQQYYFPGLAAETIPPLNTIEAAFMRIFSSPADQVHGRVYTNAQADQVDGAQ